MQEFRINEIKLQLNYQKFMAYGDKLYYPVKVNSSYNTIKALENIAERIGNQHGYLVNRLEQIDTLEYLQVDISRITVICKSMTEDDLVLAYEKGIKSFVVDDMEQLMTLLKEEESAFEKARKNKVISTVESLEITININISNITNIPENTGANKSEIEEMQKIMGSLHRNYGYSVYINGAAKRNIEAVMDYIFNVIQKDTNFTDEDRVNFVSIGGLTDSIELLTEIRELKSKLIQDREYLTEIRVEPGEWLLKDTTELDITILKVKNTNQGCAITIDGSVYDIFIDKALINREFRALRITECDGSWIHDICTENHNINYSKLKRLKIYGNSGDSIDQIGTYYISNETTVTSGMILTIADAGHYMGKQSI